MKTTEFKYLHIAETLRIKILSKFWKPGDMLPSENALSQEYKVSRMTIRKAIEILSNEGYVISKPGKGSYVKEFTINNFKVLYLPKLLIKGGFTKAELLNVDVQPADIDMVYHLQVAPYTKIVRIQTILYQDILPVALEIKYIPYFPGINIDEDSL
ncbi:MAG: GntR family transcriptional regulator, partial [Eubacteriaceae bacterium]|nr:GntR family transcriptional regulator [Eubacteriaceae bacterium]